MEVFYAKNKKYNCVVNGVPYWRTSATIGGKRRQVYGDGEKDALRKIEELKRESEAGFDLDKRSAKLGEVFTAWLFNIKRVEVKASSFARYECTYRTHIAIYPIVDSTLSKLNSTSLQRFFNFLYEDEGMTPATIAETAKLFKMFLLWAQEEGYIIKNPGKSLVIPGRKDRKRKPIEVFTYDERKKIADYMRDHHYMYDTVIQIAFATGMRQGELLALKWEDIYDDAIHVRRSASITYHIDAYGERELTHEVWDTKTSNSVRTIPINETTARILREHKKKQLEYFLANGLPRSEYVFTSTTGEIIDNRVFIRSYQRMLERAGVPYRKFHTIRHTFATEAIRRGVDVKDLQLLLGHSDVDITYIYVQSDETSRREAIEKMGEIM